jgi:PAS domain S-box-containing protein
MRNWDQVMEGFRRREVDLLGAIVRTPRRDQFANFTDTLVAVPGGIFARKAGPTRLALEDLKGRKVAVVSNYTSHDLLASQHPEIQLEVVPDVATGLVKASLGMVDAYVENLASATYYSQAAGIANLDLVGATGFDYQWAIGVRKDWPELRAILDKGLAAIDPKERQAALDRWLGIRPPAPWRPDRFAVAAGVAAVLGLLLAVSWGWNRTLRRAKARADANEARFRVLFQNLADPVYIADAAGRLIATNQQACRETGYAPDEMAQLRLADVDATGTVPELDATYRQVQAQPAATFQAVHRRKDGSTYPVEVSTRTIEFDGRLAVLGVARNVTERQRAAEEKALLQQQLQQAMKMEAVGRLAGGVAHDFNNLLTAILGNLSLAQEHPEAAPELLADAQGAAERAARLTQQLLAFSRKQIIAPRVLDLNALVTEVGRMLGRLVGEEVRLVTSLAEELWLVKVDAGQLEQVLVNLAVNARDAMPGGGTLTLATSNVVLDATASARHPQARPGPFVRLTVSDTGCGMTDEVRARLFEPFFTTKAVGAGTGLGLATIYGAVRQSNGLIEVHSKPGKGTTFEILLPRAEGAPAAAVEAPPARGVPTGHETVLLVEDEEVVRRLGARILEQLGYRVLVAGDGEAALALVGVHPVRIDLLFTDVVMPGMNGRALAERIVRLHPEAKVLFTSGHTDDAIVRHGVLEEGVAFIGKPYSPAELATKLREVLDVA